MSEPQIKNGLIRKTLTSEQARYIRLYSKKKTIKEMAQLLNVPATRIYSLINREGLDFIKTQSARHTLTNKKHKEGFFNPFAHDNWIV